MNYQSSSFTKPINKNKINVSRALEMIALSSLYKQQQSYNFWFKFSVLRVSIQTEFQGIKITKSVMFLKSYFT